MLAPGKHSIVDSLRGAPPLGNPPSPSMFVCKMFGMVRIAHNFVAHIIYYFSQKEKHITKNLHLGLLFGHLYDII